MKEQNAALEAAEWLQLTYDECAAFAHAQQSEPTRRIQELRAWALGKTWQGNTGVYDRAVYLAHLQIAGRASKTSYAAGTRDLAERALLSLGAVSKANRRLIKANLLRVKIPHVFTFATVWELEHAFVSKVNTYYPTNVEEVFTFETMKPNHVENAHFASETGMDIFSQQGLGKTGAQIWYALQDDTWQRIGNLATKTGRGRATVWRIKKRTNWSAYVSNRRRLTHENTTHASRHRIDFCLSVRAGIARHSCLARRNPHAPTQCHAHYCRWT